MSQRIPEKHSILIVDDHHIIRKTLRQWLYGVYPGATIVEASSGEEALSVMADNPVQLVLMDLHLPGMNGIEAVRAIKANNPDTYVVMLTVQEGQHYRTTAAKAGANAYVVKRQMYEDLIPAISGIMEGSSGK